MVMQRGHDDAGTGQELISADERARTKFRDAESFVSGTVGKQHLLQFINGMTVGAAGECRPEVLSARIAIPQPEDAPFSASARARLSSNSIV